MKLLLAVLLLVAVARLAVGAENETPSPEVLSKLAQDLRSKDRNVRYKATLALARVGEAALPTVTAALRDPMPEARMAAADAIRSPRHVTAETVTALTENLSYGPDTGPAGWYGGTPSMNVRWTAVAALGRIGDEALPAVAALVAMLRGEHEQDLAGPKPDDVNGQRHWRAYELRGAGAWVLQKLGPAAAKQDPQVIPALAAALADPQRMVRVNAAAALRAMGPKAKPAVPALLAALKHEDQITRVYGALAFTALGREGAKYVPELLACHNSIRLDELSRKRIREAIFSVSGRRPKLEPDAAVKLPGQHWAALDRKDFLLAVQPFAPSVNQIDAVKLRQAFLDARMGNAFTFWPDHAWYNLAPPTADELKQWGMGIVWYFFTEDIFNPKQARDWGFATTGDCNRDMAERILETGRVLGKERAFWSAGHEHMDNLGGWGMGPDGTRVPPQFATKQEGFEYYRQWITTGIHKRHWMDYGNTRPFKFFDGYDNGEPATWEFLQQRKIGTAPVTMMSGGVSPALAHAAFDILPQIGMYWWECQIEGTSLQVGSAYARGAARQYGRKWLLDASPWSPVHGGFNQGYVDSKWTGGVTDEQQLRTWLYGYLAGADIVLEEASGGSHFRPDGSPDRPVLTSTGKTAQEAARFCFDLCPERGEPYSPVGVLLEQAHGFEPRPHTPFRGSGPWGFMPMGDGEWEIEKFWYAAYPEHSLYPDRKKLGTDDPRAAEPYLLTASTFGDCFDVLTDRAPEQVLARYPRLMTLGGIMVERALLPRLKQYVAAGGELLVNAAHLGDEVRDDPLWGVRLGNWVDDRAPDDGPGLRVCEVEPVAATMVVKTASGKPLITANRAGRGKVIVVAAWHNLSHPAGATAMWLGCVTDFLREWTAPVWPVSVTTESGPPPQVMLNKLNKGWLVTVGNHRGAEWQGRLAVRLSGARPSVTDVWAQAPVAYTTDSGRAVFAATVPPYSLRTYRVAFGAR